MATIKFSLCLESDQAQLLAWTVPTPELIGRLLSIICSLYHPMCQLLPPRSALSPPWKKSLKLFSLSQPFIGWCSAFSLGVSAGACDSLFQAAWGALYYDRVGLDLVLSSLKAHRRGLCCWDWYQKSWVLSPLVAVSIVIIASVWMLILSL